MILFRFLVADAQPPIMGLWRSATDGRRSMDVQGVWMIDGGKIDQWQGKREVGWGRDIV